MRVRVKAFFNWRKLRFVQYLTFMPGSGMESALTQRRAQGTPYNTEAAIRTLSVSLLAVAAIAATLLIPRNKRTEIRPNASGAAEMGTSAEHSLDAIREAGL